MTDDHDRVRRLILSYEELDAEERAEADAILAANPAYRRLLDRLVAAERSPGPEGELPPLEELVGSMDADAREAADRSLHALRERLAERPKAARRAGDPATRRPGPWTRLVRQLSPRRSPGRIALAFAAGVALVLVLRGTQNADQPFLALAVREPAGERGAGATPRAPDAPWRTGEAFAIVLELRAPSRVVVVNVDPTGEPSLLYPDRSSTRLLPAGRPIEIPSPESGETWRLEGAPGEESFLVAVVDERAEVDLEALRHALDDLAQRSLSRSDRVEHVKELLEDRLGPTRRIDVRHLP